MRKPIILLIVLLLASCAAGAEDGLIVHYNFDQANESVVPDVSGNGNDALVSGSPKLVKRGDGFAMQFTDRKDSLRVKEPHKLSMKGDMTVSAWIKAESRDSDDQLIIGDTAGMAVNRNFHLYNSRGLLRFDHGDGSKSESFLLDEPIFRGEWQHVAFVAEYPNFYFYINGKPAKQGKMSFDITPTSLDERTIGAWWAGFFNGQLDDIRLYSRALSVQEIATHAGTDVSSGSALKLSAKPDWTNSAVRVSVFTDRLASPDCTLKISVKEPGADSPLTRTVQLTETRAGSGRALGEVSFETGELKKGNYEITASLMDGSGSMLDSARETLECGGTRYWLNSRIGVSDKVLPPWTPVTVNKRTGARGNIDELDVNVWGRTYRFGNSLFPTQIITRGKSILSSPVRVVAKVDGKYLAFGDCRTVIESSSSATAVVRVTGKAGDMTLSVRHTIEYDGLIKSDWSVQSGREITLESLSFDIPMKAENAQYLYYSGYHEIAGWESSAHQVGNTKPGVYARPFTPYLWLGDDERGLQWVCESTKGWSVDRNRAIRILKDENRVLMQLAVVDRPVRVSPDRSLSYTFGLQASPVKPIEEDCWDYRIVGAAIVDYGYDYDLLTKTVDGEPVLDYMKRKGVKTILLGNWTEVMTYTSPVGHEQEFRDLIRECHKRGIKVMPYFGYQISELAPEWPDFGENVVSLPAMRNPDFYPGMEPQMVDTVCLRSQWRNFLLETMAKLIEDYDIDGIYLDSTPIPFQCFNTEHGCGFVNEDGGIEVNFPVFDVRDFFKRLYHVVKTRKKDGIIDVHVFDSMNLPAIAWGTSYWTGEQLPSATDGDYTKVLSLDRFRADFMGVQWGIPAEFLHYRLGDYEKAFALALLHDVPVRPSGSNQEEFEILAGIWDTWDKFGRKQAEWLPYWKNSEYVRTNSESAYCSLYRHPKNGVVAVVSNLSNHPANVRVQFSLKKLGLSGKSLSARDALTNEPVALDSGTVSFDLPAVGWKLIWIR